MERMKLKLIIKMLPKRTNNYYEKTTDYIDNITI